MKKSKLLNISVVDNRGLRVTPNVIVGESNGYISGDILDANATAWLINHEIENITPSEGGADSKVDKAGDTMTGTLNINNNSAVKMWGGDVIAYAGNKISFGNIANSTQIRANDHINVTTQSNTWTVWDSGNLDKNDILSRISQLETKVAALEQPAVETA